VVIFIGGAGIYSSIGNVYGLANELNVQLGEEYDIIAFNYPTRYKYTVREMLLSINEKLKYVIHYENIHVIGISFGALLAGAFYHKEQDINASKQMEVPQIGMKFKTFTILSGLIETKFNSKLLEKIFALWILRGTPGLIHYTCYKMKIPKFVVSARSDFLVAQSTKFIQEEHCEFKIYESTILPHAFPQIINLPEAQDAIKRIVKFIQTHNAVDSTANGAGVINSGNDYSSSL
jgi:alpha-beta hydrolase superfamily lysophospholipase